MPSQSKNQDDPCTDGGTFDVLFLGTGVSTRLPRLDHVMEGKCKVCKMVLESREDNPNRRNNVSILIRAQGKNIMIDAGKSMYTAVCQFFPKHSVEVVDAVILTHSHADAAGGMDDLRDLQQFDRLKDANGNRCYRLKGTGLPMRVISNDQTIKDVQHQFPYLAQPVEFIEGQPGLMARKTAAIEWERIEDYTESIPGMPVTISSRSS